MIFDLGRGGVFANRPDATFGRRACAAARRSTPARGAVGAGTGAVAGGLQGGVGTASATLPDGTVVGALMVVNAAGLVVDPATGLPWEHDGLRRPTGDERRTLTDHLRAGGRIPSLNTTIGVVATSARLTKAECTKLASTAQDGLARAERPAHSMNDGDTIFTLATGRDDLVLPVADPNFRSSSSRPAALNALLDAAARSSRPPAPTRCCEPPTSAARRPTGPVPERGGTRIPRRGVTPATRFVPRCRNTQVSR